MPYPRRGVKMSCFIKKPCAQCPYRKDVKPFLHPARGEELAYAAENPYNTFYCHKTLEEGDDDNDGESIIGRTSKICAGFLSLRIMKTAKLFMMMKGFNQAKPYIRTLAK